MDVARLPAGLVSGPAFLLGAVGRDARDRLAEALAPLKLTSGHRAVLLHLHGEDAGSQREIASGLGMHAHAVGGVVDDLVRRGAASRTRHPGDRRRQVVRLTEHGRDLLAACERAARSVEERILSDLDTEERHRLHGYLLRMAAHV
ncbi:MarR family winged helix-turn-helix transcriptional regulator [Streptomyces sp. ODS05-4]|uniref:MarR family winged helix-turn-helix transcriptional regulator n=1 Tax=Streptomyces sp. ODS05-4 TaxID=2944939 RepID=UPI00210A5F1E|nr:MarR family transcriptional regulator [Streptomyces sp. ODS05-4]